MYHGRMRIECPDCATAYEVPEDRLAPGRVVRCARCGSEWLPIELPTVFEEEPEPDPAAEDPAPAEPEHQEAQADASFDSQLPEDAGSAVVPRPKPSPALTAAWIASVLVVLGLLWGAYSARESITHAWPASARAYAALGLQLPGQPTRR